MKRAIMLVGLALSLTACGGGETTETDKGGQTFTGEAIGYNQEVPIRVEVATNGKEITAIETSHEETPEIGGEAIDDLTSSIIATNSTDVDNIAGATVTSEAFKEAVDNALDN